MFIAVTCPKTQSEFPLQFLNQVQKEKPLKYLLAKHINLKQGRKSVFIHVLLNTKF